MLSSGVDTDDEVSEAFLRMTAGSKKLRSTQGSVSSRSQGSLSAKGSDRKSGSEGEEGSGNEGEKEGDGEKESEDVRDGENDEGERTIPQPYH